MARRALGTATLAVVAAVERVNRGEDVVVACSGGADSLALAHAVALAAVRQSFGVRAVVVDHGLQPGSAEQAAGVVVALSAVGIEAGSVVVSVQTDGSGLEAAARAARYAALTAALRPGECCYLGHTLDDQAETVLLGLARGSGTRSLAGMAAVRGRFRRPILGLTRAITQQCCSELGQRWWEDPQNSDERFSRARVRHRVLPMLEAELGPGVAAALARTAAIAREDADALDASAEAVPTPIELGCAGLASLVPALRHRVVRRWLVERGAREVTRQQVLAVAALITDWHGQRWVELSGLRVVRQADGLVAKPPIGGG